ncbi:MULTISPECIES: ABC transporter substrate-binding protein [unclassified Modestobacter]
MSSRRTSTRSPVRAARAPLALGLAALLLTACGGSDSEGSDAGAGAGAGADGGGEVEQVTFLNILPLASLSFAPELVATECGYFEDQGLEVSFETTQGSAQAIQTVLAGSALITRVGDLETQLAVAERGAPLVAVGQPTKQGTIRFISAESDPLETAEDLEGRLMGTPSEGGTSQILLELVAASAGIPAEEVPTQVVGLAPGVFDLVSSGRIGGYIVSLDTAVQLEQQQPEAVVYAPNDAISSGGQVYVTSQEQSEDPAKQEQLRRYLAAIDETLQFIIEDEANGFAETFECLAPYDIPALQNPEVARESMSTYVESWTAAGEDELGAVVSDQWEAVYEEMVEGGFIQDDSLDPSEWYTNEFLPGSN